MKIHILGQRCQSAVVPLRIDENGGFEVLVITNKSRTRWTLPKGNIEAHLDAPTSAAKEAWEEAGAVGEVLPGLLGEYGYEKNGLPHRVAVYAMANVQLSRTWPEPERKRKWLSAADAARLLNTPELAHIIEAACKAYDQSDITIARGCVHWSAAANAC